MFGYVTINKPELKIKDYEAYRGVYCSLCKALGKEYSIFARFLLNYDCTFFSLLVLSQENACPGFKSGRCRFNPAKKCNYLINGENALDKGAALTIITSYYKLLDSIHDSTFIKKTGCLILKPLLSVWHKKAAKKYPLYEEALKKMFLSQLSCEQNDYPYVDMAAEPTALMLSSVFESQGKTDTEKRVLSQFGYHMGRWIYLMDAAADIEKDFKKGNFNPFIIKYKGMDKLDTDEINGTISQVYYHLVKAYELLDKKKFADVLDNIIYSGLAKRQKETLTSERK